MILGDNAKEEGGYWIWIINVEIKHAGVYGKTVSRTEWWLSTTCERTTC
jgi:hypothetical protein